MRWVFLALAVWGAIHPMVHFTAYLADHSFGELIDAWYVNRSTEGLVWDLTIAAISLTVLILWETVRSRDWPRLIAIPATFCIGVSCGLPLYIFLRLRTASAARHGPNVNPS